MNLTKGMRTAYKSIIWYSTRVSFRKLRALIRYIPPIVCIQTNRRGERRSASLKSCRFAKEGSRRYADDIDKQIHKLHVVLIRTRQIEYFNLMTCIVGSVVVDNLLVYLLLSRFGAVIYNPKHIKQIWHM